MWPQVLAWLEAEPDQTGTEIFERLRSQHPGVFEDGQLRTLQRRLKDWRSATASRLVFGGHEIPAAEEISHNPLLGNVTDESSGNVLN